VLLAQVPVGERVCDAVSELPLGAATLTEDFGSAAARGGDGEQPAGNCGSRTAVVRDEF